jgi:hypothetical protein
LLGASLFAANASAQLQVITVPWRGDPNLQHPVNNGGTLWLTGVAIPATGCPLASASWDPGDGTAPISISVANPRVLETPHVYTGVNNQPYTATLSVTDSCGTTLIDTFRVVVIDPIGLDVEINMAIDKGLWNLHKREVLSSVGTVQTGYWVSASPYDQNRAAATASAVQAMEVHGHIASGNGAEDPYVDDVARGLAHLPTELATAAIAVQPAGNPDANGNGIGIYVASSPIYVGGQVIDALVGSATPNALTTTGPANIIGRTYADIVQDLLDMYAWGQSESGTARGGWRYSFNADSDNSTSQWWAIGGIAAERVFHSTIPQFVKDENLNFWLAYSQFLDGTHAGNDGSFGYTSPQYFAWDAGMNTTPSGLVQLVMDDQPSTDPRFVEANAYIARNWSILINNLRLYGLFATAKAMRLANPPVTLLSSPAMTPIDWYRNDVNAGDPINGVARRLVSTQQADGSWDEQLVWDDLATSWGVIILSSTIVQVGPVAVAKAHPQQTAATFPVTFDGAFSFHPDPAHHIVNYEWDFDNDSIYDATGVSVIHTFAATGDYPVTLRVTDDTTPQPLHSTDSVTVHITPPPFPPTAVPGGPYHFCAQYQPWILDGSGSSDPDGTVDLYEWDFSTGTLDFTDASGPNPTVDVTAFFTNLGPGVYDVALRVTDNNGGTNVDFTTVEVIAPGQPCVGTHPTLVCPPNFTDVWAGGINAGQTDPSHTGIATYQDACTQGTQLTHQDINITPNSIQNPGAPEVVITRRWTLTDGCGGNETCDQTITLLSPHALGGLLSVDVRPNTCPNDVGPTTGDVAITIPGTWRINALDIDPTTVKVHRADGVGKILKYGTHLLGPTYGDVTRPFYGDVAECSALGPDGHTDMTLHISARAMRSLLKLGALPDGTMVTLIVSGQMNNGDSFSLMDWVVARH